MPAIVQSETASLCPSEAAWVFYSLAAAAARLRPPFLAPPFRAAVFLPVLFRAPPLRAPVRLRVAFFAAFFVPADRLAAAFFAAFFRFRASINFFTP